MFATAAIYRGVGKGALTVVKTETPEVIHLSSRVQTKLTPFQQSRQLACASGVCPPTWGGASAREGLNFLQALAGIDLVAADINTVSPPHDIGGMIAFLAGTVAVEILTLFCQAPSIKAAIKQ